MVSGDCMYVCVCVCLFVSVGGGGRGSGVRIWTPITYKLFTIKYLLVKILADFRSENLGSNLFSPNRVATFKMNLKVYADLKQYSVAWMHLSECTPTSIKYRCFILFHSGVKTGSVRTTKTL